MYFPRPHDYASGCLTHCLTCWLGCGPENGDDQDREGDILRDCGIWLSHGVHLAVMPIARVTLESPMNIVQSKTIFYPAGFANLDALNVIPNDPKSSSLAEFQSAASRVNLETFEQHALVAFPVTVDWDALWRTSHQSHLEFIRYLSAVIDEECLNVIRYLQCRIEPVDALPGRAGQIESNHMMSGALLYNAARMQAHIIGGAAFTHFVTRGLGLPITSVDFDSFPRDGEVGHIVRQALSLYSELIEVNNATSKFIHALSLLEYLADPDKFQKFKEVKKIVARYAARDRDGYNRILARFEELTHKEDPTSKAELGYRTRIVHMGDRLEAVIPDSESRRALFEELDGYIRSMIDHMIAHSSHSLDEYLKVRAELKPFES
jgi:hypothetical protein